MGTDLFGFTINYNTVSHSGTKLYNGNISETEWKTQNDNVLRWYRYGYDALNRIVNATANSSNYNLTNVSYDKNGNIAKLKRQGHRNATFTSFGIMDDLTYTYQPTSNKLLKVADAASIDQFGFKDDAVNTAGDTADDYSYDANGNMKTDTNKGITNISYNHLNLPTVVTINGQNISYFYDATGVKLRKTVNGINTDYAGNYIYESNQLQFFSHPEGYVEPDGSGGYQYVYSYLDHIGNIRLNYSDLNNDGAVDSSEILEENNYYPGGLKHKGYNNVINGTDHKYGFNGKEEQSELGLDWLDFSARNYDPALMRWMNIDPLAEMMRRHSPYNYAFNNPLVFLDPDGMAPFTVIGADEKAQENIKSQLPEESQKYVKFDENGELDAKLISEGAEANPESGNLKRLAHLANSEDTYVYSTADHYHANDKDTGEIESVAFKDSPFNNNEGGSLGVTLPTDGTKVTENVSETSIDENTHVIVANTISDEKQAETTAHETVHAYLFDLAKNHGGTQTPWHQFVPVDTDDGSIMFNYTSPPQMKPAQQEAVKNYRANKKNKK